MSATTVRWPRLSIPLDDGEWHERLKCNCLHFRQNYLFIAAAVLLAVGWSTLPTLGAGLTLVLGAAVVGSNKALLELSSSAEQATGRTQVIPWNSERLMGISRAVLIQGQLAAASLLFWAAMAYRLDWAVPAVVRGVLFGALAALVHSSMRPVDVKSSLTSMMQTLGASENSREAAGVLKTAFGGLFKAFQAGVQQAAQPIPVVNSVVTDTDDGGVPQRPPPPPPTAGDLPAPKSFWS